MRKAARVKHKADRAWSRLDEITFGTFNVRIAAVNGVNGIVGHIDTLLRPWVVMLLDGRRPFRKLETRSDFFS